MQNEIVGQTIQTLIWSHEHSEVLRIKQDEEGVTAYFFKIKKTGRVIGVVADDTTMQIIHQMGVDPSTLFNNHENILATARHALEREFLRLYFTRHSTDKVLLDAMRLGKRMYAPADTRLFCSLVALYNAANTQLGNPPHQHFFSFDTLVWHSRPRVNSIAGRERHIHRTHTLKLQRGLLAAGQLRVSYEFYRGKPPRGDNPNTALIRDGLTMELSMSYPHGKWESADEFVNHPNIKPLINFFYSHTEE